VGFQSDEVRRYISPAPEATSEPGDALTRDTK